MLEITNIMGGHCRRFLKGFLVFQGFQGFRRHMSYGVLELYLDIACFQVSELCDAFSSYYLSISKV